MVDTNHFTPWVGTDPINATTLNSKMAELSGGVTTAQGLLITINDTTNKNYLANAFIDNGDVAFTVASPGGNETLKASLKSTATPTVAGLTLTGGLTGTTGDFSNTVTADGLNVRQITYDEDGTDGIRFTQSAANVAISSVSGGVGTAAYVIRPDTIYAEAEENLGLGIKRFGTIFLVNSPNVSSDARGKTTVTDVPTARAWDFIKAVPWQVYRRRGDDENTLWVGTTAQDLARELVGQGVVRAAQLEKMGMITQEVDAETGETLWGVSFQDLNNLGWAAFQGAQARIETLEAQVSDLVSRIEALEALSL